MFFMFSGIFSILVPVLPVEVPSSIPRIYERYKILLDLLMVIIKASFHCYNGLSLTTGIARFQVDPTY